MKRVCLSIASVVCVAALLGRPSPARAEPSPADRETARTLMKDGDQKLAAKDLAGALKDYTAAHAIMQVPSTGLSLARAQIELGLLVEARDTLLGVARLPKPAGGEAPPLAKARDEAGPLAQKLAERIPSLSVAVEGPPAGSAQVTIDGTALPAESAGTARKVNPGSHVVAVSAPGFQATTRNVVVREGESSQVAIHMAPGGPAVALPAEIPGGGHVHVVSPSEPGNVTLDGKAVGVTPLDVPVSPGKHLVEVEYPGGSHEEKRVEVAAGGRAELAFQPSAIDSLARYRRGPHFGLMLGPTLETFLDGGANLFGGTGGVVLNIGITPTFEFATGAEASFRYHHDGANRDLSQVQVVIPALLRAHVSQWFIAGAGITGGLAIELADLGQNNKVHLDYVVGPEWQFVMVGGVKREFEVGVRQGLHFGSGASELHQMLVFDYLFLD